MGRMSTSRWHDVCRRLATDGYASLSRDERTWVNVRMLIDAIEDGGVISYFYNIGADTIGDCLDDLRALGADDVRGQVERVCAPFPRGVPTDLETRNAVIDSWTDADEEEPIDEMLEEIDDVLLPMMSDLEERLER